MRSSGPLVLAPSPESVYKPFWYHSRAPLKQGPIVQRPLPGAHRNTLGSYGALAPAILGVAVSEAEVDGTRFRYLQHVAEQLPTND